MPLSAEQEIKVKELREGITAAPTSVVANNKADLLVLFDVIDALQADDDSETIITPGKPFIG